jgi:hypothetical protein
MAKFHPLQLNGLLNHRYVNYKIEKALPEAYRTVTKEEIFKPESLPGRNEAYECFGTPFVFTNISEEGYDHVCLEGQSLEIDTRRYRKIHLIGFSESVDFSEKIRLSNADGSEVQAEVFLYNLWKGLESFDFDRTSHICQAAKLVTTMIDATRAIFYCSATFQGNMVAHQLHFPFNPNMHLFSVTLEE